MSEGEHVSLGYFERDDLAAVISNLRERRGYTRVGLWGRSMGATTAAPRRFWSFGARNLRVFMCFLMVFDGFGRVFGRKTIEIGCAGRVTGAPQRSRSDPRWRGGRQPLQRLVEPDGRGREWLVLCDFEDEIT